MSGGDVITSSNLPAFVHVIFTGSIRAVGAATRTDSASGAGGASATREARSSIAVVRLRSSYANEPSSSIVADFASPAIAERTFIEPSPPFDFLSVYETWFDDVSHWVRAMGGPDADCEGLTQDVFSVVDRRLAYFDGDNLPGWLYQIARNRVREFRCLRWVKQFLFGSVALPNKLVDSGISSTEPLATEEKRETLERLLGKLNESERTCFVLFEIYDYSGEEIATIQDVSLGTVWERIHHAREKLKRWVATESLNHAREVLRVDDDAAE
jgi:RNA polymerase sigma-70 factor, ECF subfamily